MNKTDIDSILLANWYFTKCKIENPKCNKTELARKYLVDKVNSVLNKRTELNYRISNLISVN
jgi:hypothetical protein